VSCALVVLRLVGVPVQSLDSIQGCCRRQADIRRTRLVGIVTTADDRHQIDGLLRRGARAGLYDGPTAPQLIDDADDKLFNCVLHNGESTSMVWPTLGSKMAKEQSIMNSMFLHSLLPERHRTVYSLRTRRHDRTLSANTDRRNFIYRRLSKDFF